MGTRTVDSIPEIYEGEDGILSLRHEEESIVWLWTFPDLFPWRYSAEWLFSPVVGNKRWAGDLWGLDSVGNLLIVEAKNCRTQPRSNPFEDFEKLIMSHGSYAEEFTSEKLRQKWERLLKKEIGKEKRRFSNCYDERERGKTGGILPRSNHRKHIRLWKDIAKGIDRRIRGNSYKTTVGRYLKERKDRDNPVPHFFGLLVRAESMRFGLNEEGRRTKLRLGNLVNQTNVHLYEACAERTKENSLVLSIRPRIF